MSFDYWAAHTFVHEYDNAQEQIINYLLTGQGRLPATSSALGNVTDLNARLHLLAQAIVTNLKDVARAGTPRQPGGLRHLLASDQVNNYLAQIKRNLDTLRLSPVLPELVLLPFGTFALHFTFTLTSPYLSKDDTALHLLDNPMKKEWLFKLPYVASTQWKGTLQATMVKQLVEWWQGLGEAEQSQRMQRKQFVAQRIQLTRLFGTEIENTRRYLVQCGDEKLDRWYKRYVRRFLSSTGFLAGRLYFYPTFFDQLSLEVINPHDRETGAGKLPIYFEAVPAGASASFTLLYTPLDRVGEDATETRRQVFADLQLLAEGLESLFTVYGFGAKTSSGFGLADSAVEGGILTLNLPDIVFPQIRASQVQKPDDEYLKYLDEVGGIKPAFEGSGEGGMMSNREYRETGQQLGGGSLSEFRAFRQWYGEHGEQWRESLRAKTPGVAYPPLFFEQFGELKESLRQ